MAESLPGFDLKDYPDVNIDPTGWEKSGFHPFRAESDDHYLFDHLNEAKSLVKGNRKIGNALLGTTISISICLEDIIPDDVLTYALRGGWERKEALLYLSIVDNPPQIHIQTIKEIIDYYLQNYSSIEEPSSKLYNAITALGNYKSVPTTDTYLQALLTHNLIKGDNFVLNAIRDAIENFKL